MDSINITNTLGLTGLVISMIALCFTRHRHWVMAIVAGMLYWSTLELVRYACATWLQLQRTEGYLVGITLTLIALAVWLALTESERKAKQNALRLARQIEHTPLHAEHWQSVSRY